MTAILFTDCETTGLSLDDDIWEFAAIRREPDGAESEHHMFIQHSADKCRRLPDSFRQDHDRRWPTMGIGTTGADAARKIHDLTADRPHIVGAVPNFDTERLALLLDRHGYRWGAHYHLIDVENLAVGYLANRARATSEHLEILHQVGDEGSAIASAEKSLEKLKALITPPWNSDELSRAVGVEPPGQGVRHTAMGDARWCRDLYDAICGGVVR